MENLVEVVPDRVFRYQPFLFRSLFNDGGKVASTTVFHKYIENSSVSIDVTIVIAYNVVMMKIFKNISEKEHFQRSFSWKTDFDIHFCNNLLPVPFAHPVKIELLTSECLLKHMRTSTDIMVALKRTTPSDFRRTFRIIPKEPFPMTSRGSYASMKDVDDIEQRMGVLNK